VKFTYPSGEIVQKGDRIRYAGGSGVVEFVADPDASDPEAAYFVDEFGGGCMILTERFGRIFLEAPQDDGGLEYVSRVKP
jgi:hypothetical protein